MATRQKANKMPGEVRSLVSKRLVYEVGIFSDTSFKLCVFCVISSANILFMKNLAVDGLLSEVCDFLLFMLLLCY